MTDGSHNSNRRFRRKSGDTDSRMVSGAGEDIGTIGGNTSGISGDSESSGILPENVDGISRGNPNEIDQLISDLGFVGDSGGGISRGNNRGNGEPIYVGDQPRRKPGRPRGSRNRNSGTSSGDGGRNDTTGGAETIPESTQADAPRFVEFDNVVNFDPKKKRGRPPKNRLDSTGVGADLVQAGFKLPMYLGYGEHWPVTNEQARDLVNAYSRAFATLPKTTQTLLFEKMGNVWPWVLAAMVSANVLVPRLQMSVEFYDEARADKTGTKTRNNIRPFPTATDSDTAQEPVSPDNTGPIETGTSTKFVPGSLKHIFTNR